MRRISGFLDLNDYFRNATISDEDIKEGANDIDYWLKINGEEYYFKMTRNPYVELICYEIARFLGINATPYDLAIFNNYRGVISKSYRKEDCAYISGMRILRQYLKLDDNINVSKEMGLKGKNYFLNKYIPRDFNNLEIIWQAIEYRYSKIAVHVDIEKIMNDLILLLMFNILTCQNDGMPQNWELEESETDVKLVPIFDNEYCLAIDEANRAFSKLTTSFKDNGQENITILEEFLKVSSQEFVDLFIQKYNLLTLEEFVNILSIVEKKISCEIPEYLKATYIEAFSINRNRIDEVLENLGLNQSSRK